MISSETKRLLQACQNQELELVRDLIASGISPDACDEQGYGVFHYWLEALFEWPDSRLLFDLLRHAGANPAQQDQDGENMLASLLLTPAYNWNDKRLMALERFLVDMCAEAPELAENLARYKEGSLLAKLAGRGPIKDEMVKMLARRGLGMTSPEDQSQCFKGWAEGTLVAMPREASVDAWLALGLPPEAINVAHMKQFSLTGAQQVLEQMKQQPVLSAPHEMTKDKLLAMTPISGNRSGYVPYDYRSPLLQPENWRSMSDLIGKMVRQGQVFSASDFVKQLRDGHNFITLGLEVMCRPQQVMASLREAGVQLGRAELFLADGRLSRTAEAFVRTGSLPLLFTMDNWKGKPVQELVACYQALPEESQKRVRNFHQLVQVLHRAQDAEFGVPGRG